MRLIGYIVMGVLALQVPVSAAQINTDKALIEYNNKLNKLKNQNKALEGKIEVLQQQQQTNSDKIKELFHLLKYKKNTVDSKKTLFVEEYDKVAKKSYIDAKGFLMIGEHDKAIDRFIEYLALYPNNNYAPNAHYWLARAYLAKEDYQAAKKVFIEFQRENQLHHKFTNSLYELAKIYVELGQDNKAELLINTMISKFPKHASIFKARELLKTLQKSKASKLTKADAGSNLKKSATDESRAIPTETIKTSGKPIKKPVNVLVVKPTKAEVKSE